MTTGNGTLRVFGTPASAHLLHAVCDRLDLVPGKATFGSFIDGEVWCALEESVSGKDVYVIGSTPPPYENFLALAQLVDSIRRSSAASITCVIPYLGYARATLRKEEGRVSIGLPLALAPIERAGIDRLLLVDAVNRDAFAFHQVPHVDLFSSVLVIPMLKRLLEDAKNYQVAPLYDGGAKRARRYAELLGVPYLPDVEYFKKGSLLFVDAIFDDPKVLATAAARAKELGAKEVSVFFNHAILTRKAVRKLNQSPIDRIFTTDSIANNADVLAQSPKIETPFSCGLLLAEAIRRAHNGESLSRDAIARSMRPYT